MNRFIMLPAILSLTLLFSFSVGSAFAHPHSGTVLIDDHSHVPQTEILPLGPMIGLEKSTIVFHAPEDNTLPWGFVEGKISNHVEGYPVIIQIFKDNDAVHFAQTNVDGDGIYEYKFRVLNSNNDSYNKIFAGDYLVKIFKVVYLDQGNSV